MPAQTLKLAVESFDTGGGRQTCPRRRHTASVGKASACQTSAAVSRGHHGRYNSRSSRPDHPIPLVAKDVGTSGATSSSSTSTSGVASPIMSSSSVMRSFLLGDQRGGRRAPTATDGSHLAYPMGAVSKPSRRRYFGVSGRPNRPTAPAVEPSTVPVLLTAPPTRRRYERLLEAATDGGCDRG